MRAYAYLFLHSVLNSIIKLFKGPIVWIIIMSLSMGLISGVTTMCVMTVGAVLAPSVFEEEAEGDIVDTDDPDISEGTADEEEELIFGFDIHTQQAEIFNVVEIIVAIFVVGLALLFIYTGCKKGVNLFTMADVNFLFTGPFTPQGNLIYKSLGSIFSAMLLGLYLGFVMPMSLVSAGMTIWAVLAGVVIYVITLIGGQMLSLMAYMISASYDSLKNKVQPAVIVAIVALAGGVFAIYKTNGGKLYEAANTFFNHPVVNWIPYFGWQKGIMHSALYNDPVIAGVFIVLSLAAVFAILWITIRFPADFYEDAFEMAEKRDKVEKAQNDPTEAVHREKSRGKIYHRGTIGHGKGASVFFFKELYLRRRIAFLKVFTPNMLMNTLILGAGAYFLQDFKMAAVVLYLAAMLVIEVIKNFGNPLSIETAKPYLRLVPDSIYKKLTWAMLGQQTSLLIDLLPGLIIACILLRLEPVLIVGCLLGTIGLKFYVSNTGLLVDVLIPENLPPKVKSSIQITVKMLPMLPVIILITVVTIFLSPVASLYIVAIAGLVLGAMMLMISAYMFERGV